MIANEWNELQAYRKTSLGLQLFIVLLLMEVLNLKSLALAMPGTSIRLRICGTKKFPATRDSPLMETVQYTQLTRFALAGTVYFLVGFFQWVISVLIIERVVVDHFRSFMDLCSMANIRLHDRF